MGFGASLGYADGMAMSFSRQSLPYQPSAGDLPGGYGTTPDYPGSSGIPGYQVPSGPQPNNYPSPGNYPSSGFPYYGPNLPGTTMNPNGSWQAQPYNPNYPYTQPTTYLGGTYDPNTGQTQATGYGPLYAAYQQAAFGSPQMEGNIQSGIDYSRAQQQQFQNSANAAYAPAVGGGYQSGQVYSPQEIDAFTRANQYQSGMTMPDQFSQWQLTPGEQAAYSGDPNASSRYFSGVGGQIQGGLADTEQGVYGALNSQDTGIRGVTSQYGQGANSVLGAGASAIRGAAYDPSQYQRARYAGDVNSTLDAGATAARGTWNNPDLQASSDYMANYNFGPNDINDLETQAGGAARARYVDQMNQVDQAARAQGTTSPMGLAALRDRYLSQSAADAADAQTGARVQGRGLQLETMQNKENTRLGAAQHQADLAAQGELTLGGRNLQALEDTEQMRLGAAGAATGRQIGAEQGIMGAGLDTQGNLAQLGMQGEQYLGSSRLQNLQSLGGARQQALQYIGSTGSQLAQANEAAASQRAGTLASTRAGTQQQINNTQFTQNQSTQDRLAAAAKAAADQRLAFEQERRGYYGGTAGQYYQGGLTGQGQLTGAYGARTGATTGAAQGYGNYTLGQQQVDINRNAQPTGLERGIATGLGILRGALP